MNKLLAALFLLAILNVSQASWLGDKFANIYGGTVLTNDHDLFHHLEKKGEHFREWGKMEWDHITGEKNNSCVNGKKFSNTKDQIEEFVQGPCYPVVISPGLFASRLTVTIDCQTLKDSHPDIFSSCGWKDCDGGLFSPNKEYDMWISDFTSPMNFLVDKTSKCWGNLIQLNYDPSVTDITKKWTSPSGVNVSVYGEDENTAGKQECGFNAITDILPSPVQTQDTKGFDYYRKRLVDLGYQEGLNLFAVPYDWRKTTEANRAAEYIKVSIERAYNVTGKPVVVVSHSLGNFGMLRALNTMTLEQKEKMVANWLSFMPPLPGAAKAYYASLGGDSTFVINSLLGMSPQAMRQIQQASSSSADLIPKDTMERFANEPWLQEWYQRQLIEDQYDVSTPEGKAYWEQVVQSGNYTLKYFPTPLDNCTEGFKERPDYCRMNTYNWSAIESVFFKFGNIDINYTASTSDVHDLFTNWNSMNPDIFDYLEDAKSNDIYQLNNPQVPVTLVYGSHLNTPQGGKYYYDVKEAIENDQHGFPNETTWTSGDGTVPTSFSLIPAFKWAWEFNNKGADGAKPVKFVEYCATHNQRGTVYDVQDPSKPFEVNSVEYIGLDCDCLDRTDGSADDGSDCSHGSYPSDLKGIDFAINVMFGNYKNTDNYENTWAYSMNEDQLNQMAANCPGVNYEFPSFDQFFVNK